jgi:decaprenyl-phosphate phosphoribosyltransferase
MTTHSSDALPDTRPRTGPALLVEIVKLARPTQWSKGVFALVGPAYAVATGGALWHDPQEVTRVALAAGVAFVAFGLASSGCYIVNDVRDRHADRSHPRKRHRPLASGRVGVGPALAAAVGFWAMAAGAIALLAPKTPAYGPWLLGACVLLYVLNVVAYSIKIKHMAVADTISLAAGFVLRVLGGCAAAGVEPSGWLLNVTFFLSMFLALGKRLGERRTMGEQAASARGVQAKYTDDLLRMSVVVTAVATLVSYSDYVQAQSDRYTLGFNLLWLTMLPATYAMLRCIVLVERGVYDDPTELATKDRAFQLAVLAFGLTTIAVIGASTLGYIKPTGSAPPSTPTTLRPG